MKLVLFALFVAAAYSAPFQANGGWSANSNGGENNATFNAQGGGHCSPERQVKMIKVALDLLAPTTWNDTFNAVPAEGQQCFATMWKNSSHNGGEMSTLPVSTPAPALAAPTTNEDAARWQQKISEQCATYATQLNAFVAAVSASFAQLPASVTQALQQIAAKQTEHHQQQVAAQGQNAAGANNPQQKMMDGAAQAQLFFSALANTSTADRASVATVFPKLSAILTGANSQQFLTQISQLMTTISAGGQANADAIRTQAEALKTTAKAVWAEYAAANAASVQAASNELGFDISKQLEQGQMPFGQPMMGGANGSSSMMGGANGGSSPWAQNGGAQAGFGAGASVGAHNTALSPFPQPQLAQ